MLRFLSAPGGLLVLDGPPCSGKTLLLHEAADAARERGYSVVPVAGGRLAGLALDGADARTLVAVDDAHADPEGLLTLLRDRPATVLAAMTSTLAGAEVRRAVAERAEVLPLGPLGGDEVERALEALLGVPPHPELTASAAGAGGNPRLLAEWALGLREEGGLDLSGGLARPCGDRLPRRVSALVEGRLGALSAEATQLVRVAAVLGREFHPHDVATMLGRTTAALLLVVDEVLASGLVVEGERGLGFASELVWRAVVGSIPGPVRHALRRDTAVLRPPPAPPPRGLPAEEPAPRPADADHDAATVRTVRELAAGGSLGAAIALARAGLARPVAPGAAAELHTTLAGILLADGRPADAVAEVERALALPGTAEPLRGLATAGRLLSLYFATGSRAGAHALSVLSARDRAAGDADVVMAATVHSCLEWSAGNLAEGLYWGRESTRWELDGPTAWWQAHTPVAFALKLSALGEFEDAEALVRGGGPVADRAMLPAAEAARGIARSRVLAQAGRLVQAAGAARACLSLARDRGLRLLVPLASTVLATVALLRGDVGAAAEHVRCYRGALAAGEAVLHSGQYDWVELLLAEAGDGPERAAELARERVADLPGLRRVLVEEPGAAAWLVRLARAVGDRGLADAVVGAAEGLAADNPGFGVVSAGAAHARAVRDRDVEALLSATGRHQHPWAKARAHEDLAHLLVERGRPERAALHTALALRTFERMGAEHEAARLRERSPEEERAAGAAWRGLSGPERDVARLVGAGLTNRQVARQLFLSPHTVNYHLRGIFRKLGIGSRVELARLAHEQETARSSV